MAYRGINQVIMIGRLGKDIEIQKTSTGKSVARFTVAVKNGNENNVDWFNWEAWESLAEFLASYTHKGDIIYLQGHAKMEQWDSDGITKRMQKQIAERVELFNWSANRSETGGNEANTEINESEELPF